MPQRGPRWPVTSVSPGLHTWTWEHVVHTPGKPWCSLTGPLPPRCKQCSSTLQPGAYRATEEPGVFVCSSHHPTAASASSTSPGLAPRGPGAIPTDSQPPSAPREPQEVNGQRHAGSKDSPEAWVPVVSHSAAKGRLPAVAGPAASTPAHTHMGNLARPRFPAGPVGGKTGTRVTNSSPAGWASPAQDTAAVSPHPAMTPSALDPRPTMPQGRVTPQRADPQVKLCWSPASPSPAAAPAWTPSATRTQQAQERFFQTPGAATSPGQVPAPAGVPSRDRSREQALSFLQKALPALGEAGAQVPGRWVGSRSCRVAPTWLGDGALCCPQPQFLLLGNRENEMGPRVPGQGEGHSHSVRPPLSARGLPSAHSPVWRSSRLRSCQQV